MSDSHPRGKAIINGEKYYFTGITCSNGHICERKTTTGHCRECERQRLKTRVKSLEAKRRRNKKHDLQRRGTKKLKARIAVHAAVRNGILRKLPCSKCGATLKIEGHHEDYSKPLDVVWLCKPHHHQRHEEIKAMLDYRLGRVNHLPRDSLKGIV